MKRTRWMTHLSLTGLLAVSSCGLRAGDFCDVVLSPFDFEPETAARIVATDRDEAEQLDVVNSYGRNTCPGAAWRS